MARPVLLRPAARLSAFYAAAFLVTGIQLPFWPVWLAARGLGARDIGIVFAAAIWTKVVATPAIGMLADRVGRRRVMSLLAAAALAAYAALWPAAGFGLLLTLNLVALTAQSALMPLGDTVTLAIARGGALDYGRVRVWGSLSFTLAALAGGTVLARTSGEEVLPLVLGASALLLLACLAVPSPAIASHAISSDAISPQDCRDGRSGRGPGRRTGLRGVAADPRFWLFAATAAALQASHQVYYGFGTLYWRSLGFSETTIGWLWAEGVVAEIVLFWQGRRLLARFGPAGAMALGGAAGIVRWSLLGVLPWLPCVATLQLLHAFTFGASYLGAMHYLSRTVPPAAAAGAQTVYAALSSGVGGGLVMMAAGALYAAYGGGAFEFMAVLSAAGLAGSLALRRALVP